MRRLATPRLHPAKWGKRSRDSRPRVLVMIGTRPEAIKMAPVIRALESRRDDITCRVCVTGQHRELLDQMLDYFGIEVHHDLDVMRVGQSSAEVAARLLAGLAPVLRHEQPDWVLVQGDTTTTIASAVGARRAGARVGHVEAGLRTFDLKEPYPEEMNRCAVAQLADLHFAPTWQARDNLLNEGILPDQIAVTGNTGIDSLYQTVDHLQTAEGGGRLPLFADKFVILATAHRHENLGPPLAEICRALRAIAERYSRLVHIVFPVHPRPEVRATVQASLAGVPNVQLVEPLGYASLVRLLMHSDMVISDSGGLQEEAPALGKPLLVLRNVTERPEGVMLGSARLVGTSAERIVEEAGRLIEDRGAYLRMSQRRQPYGDGQASARIARALIEAPLDSGDPVPDDHPLTPFAGETEGPRSASG